MLGILFSRGMGVYRGRAGRKGPGCSFWSNFPSPNVSKAKLQLLTFGDSQPLTLCNVSLETRENSLAIKNFSTCLILLKNPFREKKKVTSREDLETILSIIRSFKMQILGAVTTVMWRRQLSIIMLSNSSPFGNFGKAPRTRRSVGERAWSLKGNRSERHSRQISPTSQCHHFASDSCLSSHLSIKNTTFIQISVLQLSVSP